MHVTPLLSWDFVHVGALAWNDEREPIACDVPRGVEIRVEPATHSTPILERERPWERGQLSWAQVMEDEGRYRTKPDGWVRFELVDRLVWPPQPFPGLEGHRFEDTQPLTGDETHALVAWNGSHDLSALKGKPVAIRVRLHKAALFSTTMYGTDDPLAQEDPRYPV